MIVWEVFCSWGGLFLIDWVWENVIEGLVNSFGVMCNFCIFCGWVIGFEVLVVKVIWKLLFFFVIWELWLFWWWLSVCLFLLDVFVDLVGCDFIFFFVIL